ncbi:YbjN domain-containing protein [Paraliomyxa miuraensis]|uniref:YbjN domain-containing protein n=1 Tax=Paraliomyxa miuraensis TaxID=376150 RepID=UPI00224D2675|nr:YbjN domain-containing protein [Paraliomyxa miuraensis]MCX4243745.1 YbjN domain-containing protein [Paraliomyxa miuraensis]
MARIFDALKAFLRTHFEEEGLEADDEDMISFRLEDEDGHEWGCLAVAEEQAEQVMFYSVVLETVVAERRNEVMRFVTMANYGMQVGNFELDLEDGEVRLKTSIDVEGVPLDDRLLHNLVELNLMMMGLYFEGLIAVMHGEATAEEAIAQVEDD